MTLAIDTQFRPHKQSFIARHERLFLGLLMIAVICLALLMGLTAPLWAEETHTYQDCGQRLVLQGEGEGRFAGGRNE